MRQPVTWSFIIKCHVLYTAACYTLRRQSSTITGNACCVRGQDVPGQQGLSAPDNLMRPPLCTPVMGRSFAVRCPTVQCFAPRVSREERTSTLVIPAQPRGGRTSTGKSTVKKPSQQLPLTEHRFCFLKLSKALYIFNYYIIFKLTLRSVLSLNPVFSCIKWCRGCATSPNTLMPKLSVHFPSSPKGKVQLRVLIFRFHSFSF